MADTDELMMNRRPRGWTAALLVAFLSIAAGCSLPAEKDSSGPSYADLVVIYNAELQSLDRLESKRKELVEQIAKVGSVGDASTLESLNAVLASARSAGDQPSGDIPADPNKALDQAVERAEATQRTVQNLLDATAKKPSGDQLSAEDEAKRKGLENELEQLDKEIIAQKQRVERAREARDAAEAEQSTVE